jgi:hypothetical protein
MKYAIPLSLAMALAAPATAQDFSAGSQASSWNLYAEQPAKFEAKVVDILCEIAGDCPDNCGAGKRQLGLVRSADNALIYPNKNNQPIFTGAAVELLPFCGQEVEVDGLMLVDADIGLKNIYQLQLIRKKGDADWTKANRWTTEWDAANPDAKGDGPWFRRDPRVLAKINAEGYFGLGLEKDAEIRESLK